MGRSRQQLAAKAEPAGDGMAAVGNAASPRDGIDYDVLSQHLGYLVRRAQLWIFQDFIRTLADADIRPAQYSVLVVTGANPGLSQIALSQALGIERARLVRVLDELQHRRLIERRPSVSDRRSHAVHLTAEGTTLLGRLKVLAGEHEKHVRRRLGADRWQALLHLLSDIANSE